MVVNNLLEYETALLNKGINVIAGVDEAGRGPLAGPVTIGCCIPYFDDLVAEVNDSKKLTEKKREILFEKIIEKSMGYSIVDIDPSEIDEINILNATKKGMKVALESVFPIPEHALIDAVKHDFGMPYTAIIHGDALSYSIAAASILAKVHRDRLMLKYAEIYPEYGFEKHKGYGTKLHIEALKKYGPCPIHRKTFIKNFFE